MSTKRLTVLHTIETDGPGGAETLVLQLAAGLDPSRFRSIALLPLHSWLAHELKKAGIGTFEAVFGRWFDPRPMLAMRKLIQDEGVDLIHSHLPRQNFYASLVGRLAGKPSLVTYHGPVELVRERLKERAQFNAVRSSAAAYLVVCNQMVDSLVDSGFKREMIVRIYNGVDPDKYSPAPNGKLRGLIGAEKSAPIVGIVANIRAPKDYDTFIRSAHIVAQRFPNARFVSIGQEEAGLSERLQALVRELKLDNQFTFLGFRSDVATLLSDFDVFVLSSVSEGFPFAAIEAMAAGKPSVMTRCGGPEEVAEEGVTGFLVPVGDAQTLATRVMRLLASPEDASLMGRNSRERILRDFTLAGMLRNYENLYTELVVNRRLSESPRGQG